MDKQKCIKCQTIKDINEFEKQKNRPNHRRKCKKCRQSERIYTEEQRKKRKIYAKEQRQVEGYFERQKDRVIKNKYGISLVEFNEKLKKQNNKCSICNTKIKGGKKTHIDHNHKTGKVRDLLCSSCNSAIGLFKENTETLMNAIRYINKHNFEDTPHFERKV